MNAVIDTKPSEDDATAYAMPWKPSDGAPADVSFLIISVLTKDPRLHVTRLSGRP